MDAIPYILKYPIETVDHSTGTERETVIRELKLAPRVKGRHMRATDTARGPVEAKLALFASLAGISKPEADELDEQDIAAIDLLYGGERTDLDRIGRALDLADGARVDEVLAAIARLRTAGEPIPVPLDDGAGSPAAGPRTGEPLPPT